MSSKDSTIVRVVCFLCYEISDISCDGDKTCDYCGNVFTEEELYSGKVIGGGLSVQEMSEL